MPADSIDFSIIIPVKNSLPRLERLLDSIAKNRPENISVEIVVSDDGSEEDLRPVCDRHNAVTLRNEKSEGPAAARNAGARIARGECFLFMDADVVYEAGLLEKAKQLLDGDPELQAVSFFSQKYHPGDNAVRNFGASIEHFWLLKFLEPGKSLGEVKGFAARNGAIRREAFESVGGFDASFKTNAHEDYDFGKRLTQRNKSVLARDPVIYHAFPDRLTRLMRNYFVRASLFVPNYLNNRPELDTAQTSSREALLRMVGGLGALFLVLSIPPISFSWVWRILFLLCALYYGCCINDFLKSAYAWSGRNAIFAAKCALIHYASSFVILAGGMWGLLTFLRQWLFARGREAPAR
jgi:glycosyltransferase involved in cell wall biosynthesis